ncbi:MAG TPA: amino acid permease [Candidatus Sulfotelmatobacter sp.]
MSSAPPAIAHEEGLGHQLTAGQMAMVGVGGSIGTGILLGSGAAMQIAGPAAILSFIAAAFICFTVTMALGELACAHPAAGSFGVYGELYLNPFAGFLARAGYWIGMALNIGAEMVATATYMAYWFPSVHAYVWVFVFAAALLLVNLSSVGSYGRFEFWLSIIKLATIAGFIVIGASLLLGGRVHPQYNASGGLLPNGALSPFVALTFALYTFGGVEMVAVATGEARSTKDTPRAVWLTFLILVFVYVGAIIVLLGVIPWNHAGVTESPFVTVFRTIKIPHAAGLMNFVALSAALSGANAALYVASRMVFSLARTGWAPPSLGRLNRSGSPQVAVVISGFGVIIAAALALWFPENAFRYLVGAGFTGMICAWLVSLGAHVNFRRRHSAAEVAALPLRSPLGNWGSKVGVVLVSLALLETWLNPRVNLFSGLACIGVIAVAYFFARRSRNRVNS